MAKSPSTSDSKTTTKKTAKTEISSPSKDLTAAPAKTRVKSSSMRQSVTTSPEDRERMIQYAAYHLAEKDGFREGREQDYWLQAEEQINNLLKAAPQNSNEQH